MKNKLFFLIGLIASFAVLMSCNDDEPNPTDSSNPVITVTAPSGPVTVQSGDEVTLDILFTDNNGLASISVVSTELSINESESLNGETSFRYQETLTITGDAGTYTFLVTVTDAAGNETSATFDITIEAQDASPVITVTTPMDGVTVTSGSDLAFDIQFADDNGLASVALVSADLSINESVTLAGETSYAYQESLTIVGAPGTYDITITATDQANNESNTTLSVTVEEAVTFDAVYAVGGMTWNEWEPTKAMPMTKDADDEGWFEITLYSDGDDDVKFIGQLEWTGDNWGLDPNDNTQMINADNSQAIVVSEVGYHVIRFNPSMLAYTITKIDGELPAPNGKFHIVGRGFAQEDGTPIDLNWDPSKAFAMTQDSRNPYLYRLTVQFVGHVENDETVDTQLKFNGNQAWDELDWGFPGEDTPGGDVIWTETAKSFGANYNFGQDRFGTYELILDEYLGLAQIRFVQ